MFANHPLTRLVACQDLSALILFSKPAMLRSKKFRPFESMILRGIALLLLGVGIAGVFLALQRANWRLALASGGILVLAAVYLCAARRGRPF